MNHLEIDVDACRARQRRVIEVMHRLEVDLAVFTQSAHVQYLTGPCYPSIFAPVASLGIDGQMTLVAPSDPPMTSAADDVLTYEAKWHSTMRNDQRAASSEKLIERLGGSIAGRRIGVEFSSYGPHLANATTGELVDLEPDLYRLRRRKEFDELARIRQAIAATEKMYARAREIIQPGITEIELFNELQMTAVEFFDEMLTGTGNDYQCGSRGGPPRGGRMAEAGELYILDLGPAFRGYFADNARTIGVAEISDAQQTAWEFIMQAFAHVEQEAKPGKSCRQLFEEVQSILDAAPVGVFDHHLGHGIGLFPHEGPHLNPFWDDTLEVGDVFTAEPGLYDDKLLKTGMRIENNYLVTDEGVELLTTFPMEL